MDKIISTMTKKTFISSLAIIKDYEVWNRLETKTISFLTSYKKIAK
ncbi:MAG: hypothetical protein CM15mV73_170 [Caudoviricetes sp.]|nr:MAG: hypothetical protein CM15mV73_170 [Caudoviricetes sp.]